MTTTTTATAQTAANTELTEVEVRNAAWLRWQRAAHDCRMRMQSFYMHPEMETAETILAYHTAKAVETAAHRAYAEIERRRI